MQKLPTLIMFDIDGTLAQPIDFSEQTTDEHVLGARPIHNTIRLVAKFLCMPHMEVMFCTGRPKRMFRPTWAWLNRHLNLTTIGRPVPLICRPDELSPSQIPAYKLSEVLQALRRMSSRPPKAWIYDDSVANLRLFQTLRPFVGELRLYRVEDGIATQWSM